MTAIALRFPAGQFHATPWGRHVNEGVPEWPPSPWRLLRTLVAVWKIRAPDLEEPAVRRVLEQLTAEPLFHLPRATTGHTRHYMRWYKKGPTDQTLIFDAFVCLSSREEVVVVWPEAELELADRDLLQRLLENFGFLGRSESWCEARLLDNQQASELTKREGFLNCRPVNGAAPQPNEETVRVLCADPATRNLLASITIRRGTSVSKRPNSMRKNGQIRQALAGSPTSVRPIASIRRGGGRRGERRRARASRSHATRWIRLFCRC